jgi:hypothetical protein
MPEAAANNSAWLPAIGAAAAAIFGLAGVFLGAYLTGRREKRKRQIEFWTRQLNEFYGPLLSMRTEIFARSNLRLKIQQRMDGEYFQSLIETRGESPNDDHGIDVLATIRDENETFRNILMPLYRQMVSTFRENMWLAEPETREHFGALIEYVSIWEAILENRLPSAIARLIGHTEQNLAPFYTHLQEKHDELREFVKNG